MIDFAEIIFTYITEMSTKIVKKQLGSILSRTVDISPLNTQTPSKTKTKTLKKRQKKSKSSSVNIKKDKEQIKQDNLKYLKKTSQISNTDSQLFAQVLSATHGSK